MLNCRKVLVIFNLSTKCVDRVNKLDMSVSFYTWYKYVKILFVKLQYLVVLCNICTVSVANLLFYNIS